MGLKGRVALPEKSPSAGDRQNFPGSILLPIHVWMRDERNARAHGT